MITLITALANRTRESSPQKEGSVGTPDSHTDEFSQKNFILLVYEILSRQDLEIFAQGQMGCPDENYH